MSNPKRHHFVPESYLNGFTEEKTGFLHIYSKRSGLWRRQKPKQVMVRNKYYRQEWAPDGVDKNILEKTIGFTTEPKGLSSLRKLPLPFSQERKTCLQPPQCLKHTESSSVHLLPFC
jgi:hypothetical protein